MYKQLIRPILFRFNPEFAHNLTLRGLKIADRLYLARPLMRLIYKRKYPALEREVFGIKFPNPVGLAGGLDKNAECYNPLSDFGFGFVEIGSLTPKPQEGNPRPRIFRLVKDRALINRMGINNKGVLHAIQQLRENRPEVIIAANIAKNTTSDDPDQISRDYDYAFSMLYEFVDFFVINVSCPNVEGLTSLQDISYLSDIMDVVLDKRMNMDHFKPILIKISPDLPHTQVDEIVDYALRSGVDGIIAGNTTRSREGLSISAKKVESIGNGGLSGAPIFEKSLEMVRYLAQVTAGKLPIIGCGGIMSPAQAKQMLDAGASLIEIYTGFIYEGPALPAKIQRYLNKNIV
ncbi:MAG: quinone-dependent dihydroorotate dehydrogenase [Bacteroidales bacterium]|nr:quinone-dependent dihydroorotate dehydrogenase [Bacteroidales bacterium]